MSRTLETGRAAHLQEEVGQEGVGLVLGQVVVLPGQHGEQQLQVLQHLHQDRGVGVEEAQREPLQDQVQTADGGLALALQALHHTNILKLSPRPSPPPPHNHESRAYLDHQADGLHVSLEVKVEELILKPLCKAGGHLGLQLLHVLVSRSHEVPLQDLRVKRESCDLKMSPAHPKTPGKVRRPRADRGTLSCFSSLILCSLALGMRMKMGPDLSSSFRFLAAGFFPAGP